MTTAVSVQVFLYDLSDGIGPKVLNRLQVNVAEIWHSSVVIFNEEIHFGPLGVIRGPPGKPKEILQMGTTDKIKEQIDDYIKRMEDGGFVGRNYNLLMRNCNTFSSELVFYLNGSELPSKVMEMPQQVFDQPVVKFLLGLMRKPLSRNVYVPMKFDPEGNVNISKKMTDTFGTLGSLLLDSVENKSVPSLKLYRPIQIMLRMSVSEVADFIDFLLAFTMIPNLPGWILSDIVNTILKQDLLYGQLGSEFLKIMTNLFNGNRQQNELHLNNLCDKVMVAIGNKISLLADESVMQMVLWSNLTRLLLNATDWRNPKASHRLIADCQKPLLALVANLTIVGLHCHNQGLLYMVMTETSRMMVQLSNPHAMFIALWIIAVIMKSYPLTIDVAVVLKIEEKIRSIATEDQSTLELVEMLLQLFEDDDLEKEK